MQVTNANLDALRVTFSMLFDEAYASEQVKTFYQEISQEIPSEAAKNVYGWLAQQIVLREWVGPRVVQNLKEHEYELPNKKYEGTIQLQREKLEDDVLGIFTNTSIPQLARGTKKHPDDLMVAALQNNVNAFDGLSWFNASHPTFAPLGATQTYSNSLANDLTVDGWTAANSAMASIPGEDGKPVGAHITHILVPRQLETKAKTIMNSQFYAVPGAAGGLSATVENVIKGSADIIVADRLNGAPTVWYGCCLDWGIMPSIYQNRTTPEFVARDNPADPAVFDLDVFTYGVRARDAVGPSLPFLIQRNTIS